MILLNLRWVFNITLLFSSFTYWLCLDFLPIYKGLLGNDFKSESSENWIRGQVCQLPFPGISFSDAEGIKQFLFCWVIPLILQFKVEVFISWIQFLLFLFSTDVLIDNMTRILQVLCALPEVLVGDWSVAFRLECRGVVGGCASDGGGVCWWLVEDVGVGVGGVEAGLDLLDVVVVVEF